MSEYIEREAALQFVFDACAECMETCEEFDGFYADCHQCMLEGVKLKLRDLKTADVRINVTGTWVGIDDYPHEDWECDRCGCIVTNSDDPWNYWHFCPNCGAKMTEEARE